MKDLCHAAASVQLLNLKVHFHADLED